MGSPQSEIDALKGKKMPTLDDIIRDLDAKCEANGHHFAPMPDPRFEYCQACGITRRSQADHEARILGALKWVT